MIKNGDDLMELIDEFVTTHDETKTIFKPIYDSLRKIVNKERNYKITWKKSREGELIYEVGYVIFIFVNPDSIFSGIIYFSSENTSQKRC